MSSNLPNWKHLSIRYFNTMKANITVARFSPEGKLLKYNPGHLHMFDNEFLEQVTRKVLKSMTIPEEVYIEYLLRKVGILKEENK